MICNAADYLESQLSYSIRTVYDYRKSWKRIRNFMALNGIKCYNQDVGEQILYHEFKDRRKAELSIMRSTFLIAL